MQKDNTTKSWKKRVPMFLAMALLAGMIALNLFVPIPEPEADSVHPFVNVNVSWLETFHSGSWSE